MEKNCPHSLDSEFSLMLSFLYVLKVRHSNTLEGQELLFDDNYVTYIIINSTIFIESHIFLNAVRVTIMNEERHIDVKRIIEKCKMAKWDELLILLESIKEDFTFEAIRDLSLED